MITTFDRLISTPNAKKIFLAEIEPTKQFTSWTAYGGSVYYTAIDTVDIQAVYEDGVALTETDFLLGGMILGDADAADMILGDADAHDMLLGGVYPDAGSWYHGKNVLYVVASSGTPYQKVIVAKMKMYFATEDGVLNDIFYVGHLLSVPVIEQGKNDVFYGVSIISSGSVDIANPDGVYDEIFQSYNWANQEITILLGGEDLAYAEYAEQFGGLITKKTLKTKSLTFGFKDRKTEFEDTIPKNDFDLTTYPNLDAEDEGRPIPLVYGTVLKVPAVCTTRALGTATSLHTFKAADTSVCTVTEFSQVYVNDVEVTHQSADIGAATFKLATSTYTPGDSVTVSLIANTENPVEIIKEIASNVLSVPYDSDHYDTATVAVAASDAAGYKCGLAVTESQQFLEIIGELMKSCLGTLSNNNAGKYTIKIWNVDVEEDMTAIDYGDIIEGSLEANSTAANIRKVVRVGWAKKWETGDYAYKQDTSDTTERVYGITRTRTVTTLLSDSDSALTLLSRLKLMYESDTISVKLKTKLQLSLKTIGDRIQVAFKRKKDDSNVSWLNYSSYEINKISKNYQTNEITIEIDDLKGIGEDVGKWTGDTPTFPVGLGGGSMDPWDPTWSSEQKQYALQNAGYWTDDDGYIDPTDPESYQKSKWW